MPDEHRTTDDRRHDGDNKEQQSSTVSKRTQVLQEMRAECERLLLSDFTLRQLKFFKRAIPPMYEFLRREVRRKKRSHQFEMLLDLATRPESPVDVKDLQRLRALLSFINAGIAGDASAPSSKSVVSMFIELTRVRKKPTYWNEYLEFLGGKPIATIIREHDPEYDQLDPLRRVRHFRKVYNAIQRLVERYGGHPRPSPDMELTKSA